MKKLYFNYRYEIIAALSGAIVMILELVGARMVAPYFGTSLYVWTAMIGVILGALSLGYWLGGRIADKRADDKGLMTILIIAAGLIFITVMVQQATLETIAAIHWFDTRVQALIGAVVLFAPASMFLGIVSPYVAKLRVTSLATAGQSIGRLYAAGTFGSIAGTFLAGYFLIALLGNISLTYGLVIGLLLVSLIADRKTWLWARIAAIVVVGLVALMPIPKPSSLLADIDTAYGRYQVYESAELGGQRQLVMDNSGIQSAAYVDQPDVLPLTYTQSFKAVSDSLRPDSMLVIGGGTFTFPSVVARNHAETKVDVVEIDPALEGIAKDYFGYQSRPNLNLYFQDGRAYLNHVEANSYDAVFLDAFSSLTPPYQLATHEAMLAAKESLKDDGVLIVNIIGDGSGDPYVEAMMATFRSVFKFVDLREMNEFIQPAPSRNLIAVMSDDKTNYEYATSVLGPRVEVASANRLLTDDYAPVEQLIER